MGCHPVRARTDSEDSSDARKEWEMNGLYAVSNFGGCAFDLQNLGSAERSAARDKPGLAQASQASAATSPIEFAMRRLSWIEDIHGCSTNYVLVPNPFEIIFSTSMRSCSVAYNRRVAKR